MSQRRFLILSKEFLMNCEADFKDKECTDVTFQALKWKVPIAALTNLSMEKSGDYIKVQAFFNLTELNKIMEKHGAKKPQKKDKRSLKFTDKATCRDFVFHLKRLHHYHRCSKRVIDEERQPKLPINMKSK